jgi:hypothetical protein
VCVCVCGIRSDDLQSWCLIVFHTEESLAMSSDRLAHHQNSMGLVFHTATFNKDMLETAVNALQQDKSWTKRCAELRRPKEAKKIGKIVTHDVPSDHWAAKNRVFDDKDLATHADSKDTLAKKLPAELREKFVRGQEVCPIGMHRPPCSFLSALNRRARWCSGRPTWTCLRSTGSLH